MRKSNSWNLNTALRMRSWMKTKERQSCSRKRLPPEWMEPSLVPKEEAMHVGLVGKCEAPEERLSSVWHHWMHVDLHPNPNGVRFSLPVVGGMCGINRVVSICRLEHKTIIVRLETRCKKRKDSTTAIAIGCRRKKEHIQSNDPQVGRCSVGGLHFARASTCNRMPSVLELEDASVRTKSRTAADRHHGSTR